uniref:Endoplasmic reticulum vesicle transporter n=1 Tax=Siphoviridae sp. ct43U4 TaxID=2826285 RepID=A0A8S5N097_9CAUD|nr:MAG TPA: Endoplasmic reticulum vesicle transporter [Siphoviridae sp. ct43U4]
MNSFRRNSFHGTPFFIFDISPLKISDSRHMIPFRHIYTSRLISWLKQGKNQRL